ncbi:hypothetical protein GH714_007938 [Hevea brasiliensis]|uniref:Leucine-rich repeat-containing N-terminal plant-type domain-containing protein n=1 Tax=Hevea brasiliensis TaxID=3981 RepID=A0A6A6L1I6_HEVBR|nr:hypothetical protein GH714_007938 [Hevea brasiliensis]
MIHLVSLYLGSNNFHGPIPETFSSCHSSSILDLSGDKLGGEVPSNFKNLQALTSLSLSNTNITNISAALGILQKCKNLTFLDLNRNFQDEQMPSDVNLQFKNLRVLLMQNCQLRRSIPLWLRGCKMLQLLVLSWNLLGETVPSWLGNFNSLFYLDLSNNLFTGEIPISLTGLQTLTNRNNLIDGNATGIPLYKKTGGSGGSLQYKKIGSLPPTIDLSYNKLIGPIWPSFGNLKSIHVLKLKKNELSGPIPSDLSGMSSLEILDLSHNKLTGEIPSSLVKLGFLSKFSVAYNQIYGEIPTGGQFLTFPCSSFEGNNGLYGGDGAFTSCQLAHRPLPPPATAATPASHRKNDHFRCAVWDRSCHWLCPHCYLLLLVWLGDREAKGERRNYHQKLRQKHSVSKPIWRAIQVTYWLSMVSPCLTSKIDGWNSTASDCCTWTGVTCDNSTYLSKRVIGLELGNKRLTGMICESLAGLDQLRILNLSHNLLHGTLPAKVFGLQNLEVLDLSNNDFVDSIPPIGKMSSISGYLPESLVNSPSLITLDLDNNTLNGAININCSAMIHLVSLNLGSNNFHGPIPESISYCQSLNILNLSKNKLGGEIPYNFKNFQALTSLSLSKNNLANISGALGILQHCKNLTTLILSMNFQDEQIPGNFNSLFYLDLSNNSFTGGIPMSLTGLQTLTDRNISTDGNAPCVPLYKTRVPSGSLQYNKIGSLPPTLDLSCNKLTGPIWPSFGNLTRLHVLKLNKNDLSGPIPDSLSGMSSLETLDLSYNKLSGEIPTSLVKLNFLSKFSVAYNQLCGEIPTGGQFLTFPIQVSWEKGLGARDFAFCQLVDSPREQMTIIGLPFAVGSATGFVLTLTSFFRSGWVFPKPERR